ncbi:DUF4920 domain-containing protein [Mucilaginibacter robiniae]|uniref:DUF4920 domain-containing protein n=1 Tax=Mucilaginibacter robiniae TaxID=2728022 RepID=A0A7L5E6N7_9SPHI|nr:DUF4920 domain-containing protein [Mucilaginibacter robiniae]QJD96503.1 DUF4920 domain-containing protein [Mucilaginibacter robiniae]
MKFIITSLIYCCLLVTAQAQKHTPLPHGMVFGSAPSHVSLMPASKLETFMGKRTRTTASVIGTVIKVTKPKGGWFILDAGNGQTIQAHFRNYNVVLPEDLKGRQVVIAGVAQKEFIADDHQQLAGNRKTDKNTLSSKNKPPQLTYEVTGLFVNK